MSLKPAYRRERMKTIIIGLLFLLLVCLTLLNFLYDRIQDADTGGTAPLRTEQEALPNTVYPITASQRLDGLLTGAAFDSHTTDALFEMYGSLLGVALASARDAQTVSVGDWEKALMNDGVYFGFLDYVPAWMLAEALSQTGSEPVAGLYLDRLLLTGSEDGGLLLLMNTRDGFLRFTTPLVFEISESGEYSVTPNRAEFALGMGLPGSVPSDTLFTGRSEFFTALAGDTGVPDESAMAALLSALDFNPNTNQRYPNATGEQVVVDGQRTLHIAPDGTVTYNDSSPPAREAVPDEGGRRAVRTVLGSIPQGEAFWGEGRLHLRSVEETPEGVTVTFSYLLHGAYVAGGESVFVVRGGKLREAIIKLKPLYITDGYGIVMPQRQAALLLPAGSRLTLGYTYSEGVYLPGWMYYSVFN